MNISSFFYCCLFLTIEYQMCTSCFKQVQICKVERIKIKMGIGRWRLKIFVVFLRAVILNPISLALTWAGCLYSYTLLYMW